MATSLWWIPVKSFFTHPLLQQSAARPQRVVPSSRATRACSGKGLADVYKAGWQRCNIHLGRHSLLQLLRGVAHARHPLICSVADAVAVALEFQALERSRRVAPRTGWAASSALPLELAYFLHLGFVAGRDRRLLRAVCRAAAKAPSASSSQLSPAGRL